MRTQKGIFYFDNYCEAKAYALKHEHPTDRIRDFEVGWAIQLYRGGPYVGSKKPKIRPCPRCGSQTGNPGIA